MPRLASSAESVFISVVAAPLVMEAAMLLSMLVAAGAEITASLDVLVMARLVSSGVFRCQTIGHIWPWRSFARLDEWWRKDNSITLLNMTDTWKQAS